MIGTLFVLRSVTYAYKAHQIMQQNWIQSSVVRTPKEYANRGCGFSLLVQNEPDKARQLLQQYGIRILAEAHNPVNHSGDTPDQG